MALNTMQMACFENNVIFLSQVAAALLPIATEMKKRALVIKSDPASTEVEQSFAAIWERLADQILNEQGVNMQILGGVSTVTAAGSVGMKYLIRQLLMSDAWTLTPDAWAADEIAARVTIRENMTALLGALTAIPVEEA